MNYVPLALAALTLSADPTPPTPVPADPQSRRKSVTPSTAKLIQPAAILFCLKAFGLPCRIPSSGIPPIFFLQPWRLRPLSPQY